MVIPLNEGLTIFLRDQNSSKNEIHNHRSELLKTELFIDESIQKIFEFVSVVLAENWSCTREKIMSSGLIDVKFNSLYIQWHYSV